MFSTALRRSPAENVASCIRRSAPLNSSTSLCVGLVSPEYAMEVLSSSGSMTSSGITSLPFAFTGDPPCSAFQREPLGTPSASARSGWNFPGFLKSILYA